MNIPTAIKEKYEEISSLIKTFCKEKLNEDYEEVCIRALEKLSEKHPSPLLKGKANTWACGIVYAIGSNNFLFDKTQEPYIKAKELAEVFGISTSTAGSKAKEVRDYLNISWFSSEWLLVENINENPLLWMVQTDEGFVADIRNLPEEVQLKAFEKGMIPFIPAKKEEV